MTDTDLIATSVLDSAASAATSQAGGSPTSGAAPAVATATKRAEARRGSGLSGMVLAELRALAGELGIKGTSGMRKGDLIAAIKERQSGGSATQQAGGAATKTAQAAADEKAPVVKVEAPTKSNTPAKGEARAGSERSEQAAEPRERSGAAEPHERSGAAEPREQAGEAEGGRRGRQRRGASRSGAAEQSEPAEQSTERQSGRQEQGGGDRPRRDRNQGGRNNQDRNQDRTQDERGQGGNGPRNDRDNRGGDDEGEGRGRRGRRFRERRRGRDRGEGGGGDVEIREDDVLQPVAGILDVLDNYAFVRTSGYLAGPNDVYVSMNLIRKNGLRRGDAITGAVRVPREGEGGGGGSQRQKFNPLVRIDTVNGGDVEAARKRPEFGKLTPLYPNQRLRLETTPNIISTRVIDLVMPIGKGQRALIVSPPKAGKTTVIQDIANAIATNNPECYLMVVLVDERPEEVTDMQRSVKGEVIASTFDRPPSDHTSVAELAIERAKRLVENGRDVVVLLDSITRLGRAYNNSSPASGRILSGGVDSTALYPPKRFLGAARNIENGGSLTIIASALVETGSTGDTVIFEEFKGTGNAELKLDRKIAERRVFPAVDVNMSSTRKDELLMNPDEFAVVHKLRRVLSGLDTHQAIDLLVNRLKKSKSNVEFLMEVSKTAPGAIGDD
ncbi:transcription termination factor Rho [Rhodococcus sp. NPDC058505]|uniref:transcription termination factor Rho n=1 Tax=Rhodococcus sp. NPDC058505 TaxID=3346531 RepID=UPI00364FBBDA